LSSKARAIVNRVYYRALVKGTEFKEIAL
jgi:hypothetical protein